LHSCYADIIEFLVLFALLFYCGRKASHKQIHSGITFKDAEKSFSAPITLVFLPKSITLMPRRHLVKQAKLWDNPVLSTDQNITDANKKFFDHSNGNGQVLVQLSQVFKTAGKRGKQVQVASDDVKIQQAQFNDLLRNLHYNLLLDFSQVANLIDQRKVYQTEIASATNMVNAIDKSYQAGNNSLKDVIRLKALNFGLQNDHGGDRPPDKRPAKRAENAAWLLTRINLLPRK
jgi:cobalt-zinc-cadmium efflux system outer membrane protein